jgi:hypothetical protein
MFYTLTEINKFLSVLQHFPASFACCFVQILARLRGGAAHFGPQNTQGKPPKAWVSNPLLSIFF